MLVLKLNYVSKGASDISLDQDGFDFSNDDFKNIFFQTEILGPSGQWYI